MGRDLISVPSPPLRQGPPHWLGRIDWNWRAVRDAAVIFALAALSLIVSEWFDLFAGMMKFQAIYGDWGLDDIAMALIVLVVRARGLHLAPPGGFEGGSPGATRGGGRGRA